MQNSRITPMVTECKRKSLEFEAFHGRKVVADFAGGDITSDAGFCCCVKADRVLRLSSMWQAVFRMVGRLSG